jgi:hypothetical protein
LQFKARPDYQNDYQILIRLVDAYRVAGDTFPVFFCDRLSGKKLVGN